MLPLDAKQRKQAVIDKSRQLSVTDHVGPEAPDAKPIPYSAKALETASLEWLIETNQVCSRLRDGFPFLSHTDV